MGEKIKRAVNWLIKAALVIAVIYGLAAAGLILFGATATAPPPMAEINGPIVAQDVSTLPKPDQFKARDGAALVYRRYAGRAEKVVILIHGSTGNSANMHTLARALAPAVNGQGDQPTVYALDMRGHGDSGTLGQISYIGQLEDDLEDFVADRRAAHLGGRWSLAGFSSGGGFAMRLASEAAGTRYDRIVALAPALSWRAPTTKPEGEKWAVPYVPRVIGLSMLERIGLHQFEYLPALQFGRRDAEGRPYSYSYAMLRNFGVGGLEAVDLTRAAKAPIVIVGEKDELFRAEAYAPYLKAARPDISVTVLPGLGHMDMTFAPAALAATVAALKGG